MITPMWHIAAGGLSPDEFRRVRDICRRHGGMYVGRLGSAGRLTEPGYIFLSLAKAQAAQEEIDAQSAE